MSALVGIRGAVQVPEDSAEAIDAATRDLLAAMVERNGIDPGSAVAIWFTQTPDLTAAYAASAARNLGWRHVPLLGAQEAAIDGQLPRVVRALLLAPRNAGAEVRHAYLGAAKSLREDLP
ncbi:MAG TPA: chorismate mutase [Gemmatimonadota bacterium]|nr:chorismate mutase [Gemmatimonadota bacterium]